MRKLMWAMLLVAVGCNSPTKDPQAVQRQVLLCGKQVTVAVAPGFKPKREEWVAVHEGKLARCWVGECAPSGWECPPPPPKPKAPLPGMVYVIGPYQEALTLCEKHGGSLSEAAAYSCTGRPDDVAMLQFDGKLRSLGSIHFMSADRGRVCWVNEDGTLGWRRSGNNVFKNALTDTFSWECQVPRGKAGDLEEAEQFRKSERHRKVREAEKAKAQKAAEEKTAARAAQDAAARAKKESNKRAATARRAREQGRQKAVSETLNTLMEDSK